MSTLNFCKSEEEVVTATVRESDPYTKSILVKFDRTVNEEVRGCNELYLTPTQLDHLGRYFIRKAEEINMLQVQRQK